MSKISGLFVFLLAASGVALAGDFVAPEIDATAAVGALALLGGGMLVIRSRRRQ